MARVVNFRDKGSPNLFLRLAVWHSDYLNLFHLDYLAIILLNLALIDPLPRQILLCLYLLCDSKTFPILVFRYLLTGK